MVKSTWGVVIAAVIAVGCGGSDPSSIASGLDNPLALMVSGGKLFWLEDATNGNGENQANSKIQSMPTTGGTPTTVLTQAYLDGNLATDGTKLYFSYTMPNDMTSTIASCGLDGSNVTTLATNVYVQSESDYSEMFVVNGTVYVMAQPCASSSNCSDTLDIEQPYSVSTTGGMAAPLYDLTVSAGPPSTASLGNELAYADTTGAYYSWVQTVDGTATFYFSDANTKIISIPVSSASDLSGFPMPGPGAITEASGTVFYLTSGGSSGGVTLWSVAAGTGTPSMVANFQNQNGGYLVGDANGLYMNNQVASNKPGIFSVTLSGTQTSVYTDNKLALSTSVGNDRIIALDSTNIYWVGGGFNAGQAVIHMQAR